MAMDLFSLFGSISVKYADAVDDIDRVTEAAKEAAGGLEDMEEAAGDAQDPIEEVGDSADEAERKFSTWRMTLANLAADAISKVIDKCTELAASVVGLGKDFTATMSEVRAISGATDEQMVQLEETARKFGATTVFSATEAAEALKYMSLAGWSVEESTSALGGVLDLAAASGMGLGQASDMVTDYLSAFGLSADKAAYFADLLASAQKSSNTTAEALGEAYKNCAANLNAAGQDVETVTSLLEAMANQGYKGSEAGTALAAIMRDITNAMDEGAIEIGDTSIAVMDAAGNYRDLTGILADVEAAVGGMGSAERAAALSSSFTADSTKGLNLILNEGVSQAAGYEEALRKADGAASDMAATMNDNLSGDLANMNSAFEELKLKIFDGFEKPLRSATQFVTEKVVPAVTDFVENFDKAVPAISGVTTALVTCKAAVAISSVISTVSGAWRAYKTANEGATVAQWLLNAALGANPIAVVIGLLAGLIAAVTVLWNTNEDFRNNVIALWESIQAAVGTAIEAISSFISRLAEDIGNWLQEIWDSAVAIFDSLVGSVSEAWETIKAVVQVAILFIAEILNAAFELITIPFQFIWENCKEYIIAAWEVITGSVADALTAISEIILAAWEAIVGFMGPMLETLGKVFSDAWEAICAVVSSVSANIYAVISDNWNRIQTAVTAVLNRIQSVFDTVWDAVRSKVSGVINSVKSTVSSGLESAHSTVTNILTKIRDKFRSVLEGAQSIVSSIIDRIKGLFHFEWSLPKLKLPHVNISGEFSLVPPSVPHFSIDWYAKAMREGMILNEPTIFGYNPASGEFLGGGEAGSEAVVGTGSLMAMIRSAAAGGNDRVIALLEQILELLLSYLPELSDQQLVLDSGLLVGGIGPRMSRYVQRDISAGQKSSGQQKGR